MRMRMRISTILVAHLKNGMGFSSPLVVIESDPYASSIAEHEGLEDLDAMLKPMFVVLRREILTSELVLMRNEKSESRKRRREKWCP
jgi:hypothetical protein